MLSKTWRSIIFSLGCIPPQLVSGSQTVNCLYCLQIPERNTSLEMSYCSSACGQASWEMFILADILQNEGKIKFQNTVVKCWHAQSPSASQTALLRHKNVTRVYIFLSLGYRVKAFPLVSPENTRVPSFQRNMLVCFDTGASSQPVPGQMYLSEVLNMEFL